MTAIFDYIAEILCFVIRPIYSLINNYGWTIILFTILIKLVTLPFTIKSQKSMARMQQVQPLISEIQKKYANNQEKMQEELQRVYARYDISPTGGCLPMIVQLVILMGFIQVVYKPVTFLLGISKDTIAQAATSLGIDGAQFASNQLNIFTNPEMLDALGMHQRSLNFDFFGIDLTKVLSQNMGDFTMWILPILALAFSILSTYVSQKQASAHQSGNNDSAAAQSQAMTKSMYIMMPLMTAWITYSWPLGCALYWIISTVTQIGQQLFINKFIVEKMKPIDISAYKKKKKKKKVQTTQTDVIETTSESITKDEGENDIETD